MSTILIVEDEPAIAESVAYSLRREGFDTLICNRLGDAWDKLRSASLIVLDLMLPDGSGFELIRSVRKDGLSLPIIVLSSRDAERDRIGALEGGADDYVTKPFSPREVVARVRAVLRRLGPDDDAPSALSVNAERREAKWDGRDLELTRVEFDLLSELLKTPGKVFTRAELIDQVWGTGFRITDRTVDSHIKSLRRKIEKQGGSPEHIETVRGVGYRVATLSS